MTARESRKFGKALPQRHFSTINLSLTTQSLKQVLYGENSVTNLSNYESLSKSFRTGRLERELQMVQLSATRRSCIAILVSFAAIILCVASRRVFIVVSVYSVIDSVRKLLDTPSYDVDSPAWLFSWSCWLEICPECGGQSSRGAGNRPVRFEGYWAPSPHSWCPLWTHRTGNRAGLVRCLPSDLQETLDSHRTHSASTGELA
jgi:hypothetical protein